MSDYSIYNDPFLKNYVAFKNHSSDDYVHRSHEANFYYCSDTHTPNDTETFLLMPAGESDEYTWYFVFIKDVEANACWTVDTEENSKLTDKEFLGHDNQKFAFISAGGDYYNILCKGSGYYLKKEKNPAYCGHQAIRQRNNPTGDDKTRYQFLIEFLSEEVKFPTPPAVQNTCPPGQLPNPPIPNKYGDQPEFPAPVLIGQTVAPFFNITNDPNLVGSNLMKWQIANHPYYEFKREQQWQYGPDQYINAGGPPEKSISKTFSIGIDKTEGESMETTTSFIVGVDMGKTASLGISIAKVEASKGFNAQWGRDLTITISESTTVWASSEKTEMLNFENADNGVTYIIWQLFDMWTVIYDTANSQTWSVGSGYTQPEWFPNSVVPIEIK